MKRRDSRLLVAALVLLALPALWLIWNSREVEKRREATLAGVPQFPAPHQAPRRRPMPPGIPPRPPEPARVEPPGAPAAKPDPVASFALGQPSGGALIQVNALFNTPLFDRLRRCLPRQFASLDEAGRKLGVDLQYDVDRVALSGGGVALSGFFEGKPVAETMMGPGADRADYRGAAIYTRQDHCTAQMGNLVLTTLEGSGDCRALVDRALAPAPAGASDELYGDVFLRTDLASLRAQDSPPEIKALIDGLDKLTLRANVWASVALSLEGAPQAGRSPRDLAQMAQGAVALVKSQLDEDQVEFQTLADLAKVSGDGSKLQIDLALPANDLFDRFRFPCDERDAGPQ
jgi:hypothetical protein